MHRRTWRRDRLQEHQQAQTHQRQQRRCGHVACRHRVRLRRCSQFGQAHEPARQDGGHPCWSQHPGRHLQPCAYVLVLCQAANDDSDKHCARNAGCSQSEVHRCMIGSVITSRGTSIFTWDQAGMAEVDGAA